MALRFDAAAASDIGPHRSTNQDAAYASAWAALVADGVGGGPSGDLASAALVHRVVAGGPSAAAEPQRLADHLRVANWDLRAHVEREPELAGMATTFTGVFAAADGSVLLAHSGDSRAYLLRDGELSQQTRDDSYVQALVDHGVISASDAATHPRRNLITASFAGAEGDAAAIGELDPREGDRWLLCSDGLSDYVPMDDVVRVLRTNASPRAAADALVALALEAGTMDNVTAVVCDIHLDEPSPAREGSFVGAAAERFQEGLDAAG
jgi:PPM family protein phosphatase